MSEETLVSLEGGMLLQAPTFDVHDDENFLFIILLIYLAHYERIED
jgi:hypothetical protein